MTQKELKKMIKESIKEVLKEGNDIASYWDRIVELDIATDDELSLVTDINGYTIETLNDVIFARTGYRDLEGVLGEIE